MKSNLAPALENDLKTTSRKQNPLQSIVTSNCQETLDASFAVLIEMLVDSRILYLGILYLVEYGAF